MLVFGDADPSALADAARACGLPMKIVEITDQSLFAIYQAKLILVRPDHHVAWRGNRIDDPDVANRLVRTCLGW